MKDQSDFPLGIIFSILISFLLMIDEGPSVIILFCNTACTGFAWHNSRQRPPKRQRVSGRLRYQR